LLHAGAAAVTGLTALQGIDDHLRVRGGTTILIFGATGAVGTLAVQFAKRHGAHVIGTARGRAAMALLKKLRVDGVVDLNRKDEADQLRALAPDGIDAALALAGGKALEQLLNQMRAGGRIAFPNGLYLAPRKRSKIRISSYDAIASPKHFAQLKRAVEEARLQVPIAAVYALAQAAKAHERIKRGHVLGRIVLRIR
jgi:NADPH:quinone reductase-like Zn-dependent oxidoreductase